MVGVDDHWQISAERRGPRAAFVGAATDTLESLTHAVASFRGSDSWSKLQPLVFQVAGQYSFGLGVLYGIGENIVGSVVELGQLAKTLLLADLYDRTHQPVFAAALGPTGIFQRLMAEASMAAFGNELEEARVLRPSENWGNRAMSVANERFRQGDVFIDYAFEDVMFRYDASSRRFFRRF